MKKVNVLSKAEMKKVVGGIDPNGAKYMCCPDGYSQGSSGYILVCSDCVYGNKPVCSMGNVETCS